jgi:hypothetical protein
MTSFWADFRLCWVVPFQALGLPTPVSRRADALAAQDARSRPVTHHGYKLA